MASPTVDLVAGLAGLWWVFALLVAFGLGVMWPVMLVSIVLNIRGIRRELSTLNETLQNKLSIR